MQSVNLHIFYVLVYGIVYVGHCQCVPIESCRRATSELQVPFLFIKKKTQSGN